MMPGGQSINDRLQAARYSIAGQGLAKSVCKSTTEEVIGPKKKHLDYLLHCTNEPNVSIPQLANLLIERTTTNSWVVVFKALVTVHHLMCYGNERFTQYLASSNCSFQLSNFVDKANVQGYDMSTFIRRYAKYLNEKALSYRTVAFDFCKVKRGKDDGVLRTMNADKLLKTLPVLQNQVDALLEFDCTANELTNGVINAAFMLLFRDLIRLFACYNDGIINLLEKYFDMNKKMCRDALDIYKKFLIRMDRVGEFLKVAESMGLDKSEMPDVTENVGIDKSDIPDLAKLSERCRALPQFGTAPSSLLDALEQHLQSLEGKKGSGAGTPTQPPAKPAYLKHAVTALSNTSNAFGSAAASSRMEMNGVSMDENLKKIALEEEQAALNQHRERRMKELAASSPTGPPSGSAATNPFLTSPSAEPVIDLFDPLPSGATSKTSDDLLCLKSNPFADSMLNTSQPSGAPNFQNSFWGAQNGFTSSSSTPSATATNAFVSEYSFAAAFGNESNSNATSGPTLMSARAPEITVDDEGGHHHDLDIPGLNPFANISSTTPSPSGAPEIVRGAGTTPILGGPDGPHFGVPFGEAAGIEAEKTGDDIVDAKSPVRPPPAAAGMNLFPDFDSGFGGGASGGDKPPRPVSPAGMAAPPKSVDPFGDIGGDFGFGGVQSSSTGVAAVQPASQPAFGGGAFDFGGFDSFGDILQPVGTTVSSQSSTQTVQTKTAAGKVITGDLDSSLAILAQNLDINRGASSMQKGGHVWNSPKNTAKTGGANWAPQIASSTAAWNSPQHGFKTPMSGMTGGPGAGQPADWSSGLGTGAFQQPGAAPMMGQQFMGGPRPPMGAMGGGGVGGMGMAPPMGAMPHAQQQQSMFSAIPPRPAMQAQAPMGFTSAPPTTQPAQGTTLDPFGAL